MFGASYFNEATVYLLKRGKFYDLSGLTALHTHAQKWVNGKGQLILMQSTLKLEFKPRKQNKKQSNKLLFEPKK